MVQTVEPMLNIQTLPIKDGHVICRCKQGIIYIATSEHVYCIQSVPRERQIRILLEQKQFQLASKLTVCILLLFYSELKVFNRTNQFHHNYCVARNTLISFLGSSSFPRISWSVKKFPNFVGAILVLVTLIFYSSHHCLSSHF